MVQPTGPSFFAVGLANLMESLYLFQLQLRHFLRPRPDDGAARFVGFQHEGDRPFHANGQRLAQHLDYELHRMVVVIFQNDVIRRHMARARFFFRLGFRRHSGV